MNLHRRSGLRNGAPFASLFLILLVAASQMSAGSKGFRMYIAVPSRQGLLCGEGKLITIVRVLGNGSIALNGEALELAQLPGRLRENFGDRVENVVFILADNDAAFGQVSTVIETVRPRVDHIALLSHAVQRNPGDCGPTFPDTPLSR